MSALFARFRQLGHVFACLWLSETITGLGSMLLQFSLGVWIYQKTGSAEQFSLALLCGMLPALLLLPIAGACADLFDRRTVLIGCDLVLMILILLLSALVWCGWLQVWSMMLLSALVSLVYIFRRPSYQVALSQVLPPERLSQANGLRMLSESVVQFVGPILSGGLMFRFGLSGIMLLEMLLIVSATILVLLAMTHMRGSRIQLSPERALAAVWRHCRGSMGTTARYLRLQSPMLGLLVYMLLQTGLVALVSSMLTPMVLARHDSGALGEVMSCGAMGAIMGSLAVAVLNPQRRLMRIILLADLGLAGCVAVAGVADSPLLWSCAAFLAMFAGSISNSCTLSLWMRKTPVQWRGSLFSLLGAVNIATVSLVLLAGGMLVERVLEPGMMAGGPLAAMAGDALGTGKGRGVALLFVLCGAASLAISAATLLFTRLAHLDERVRDDADGGEGRLAESAP